MTQATAPNQILMADSEVFLTGTTSVTSNLITMTNTTGITAGMLVFGIGIVPGTTVLLVTTNASVKISTLPTVAGTASFAFGSYNNPNSQLTNYVSMYYAPGSGTNGGVNVISNSSVNSIDPATHSSTIAGGGELPVSANIGPNQIGIPFAGETGTYVSGTASYSSILGGYDNINNAIGSVLIGDHHRIHSSANHASVLGGSANEVKNGSYNSWLGGGGLTQGNVISGAGNNRVGIGGLSNTMSGSGNGSVILGGNGNTDSSSGSYNVTSGQSNTLSGTAQMNLTVGSSHTQTKSFGLTVGTGCKPISSGAITVGGKNLVAVGDNQLIAVQFAINTTDATIQTMTITSGGDNITFDNTKKSLVIGSIYVGCLIPGTMLSSGYQTDFVGTWDGSNLVLSNSVGTVSGAAVTLNLVQINNNAGIVTVPLLAGSTGVLRARVTGLAGTNISWWGSMWLSMGYV